MPVLDGQYLPGPVREASLLSTARDLLVRYFWAPGRYVDLSEVLMSVAWEESEDQIAREFTLVLDNWNGQARRVVRGGAVVLFYNDGQGFQEWIRGPVVTDETEADASTATKSITVYDLMRAFGRIKGKFSFRAQRTASQSITDLCKKYGIKVGGVANTHVKLAATTYEGTLYDAMQLLLKKTVKQGGNRYVPEFHAGKFYLVHYRDPVYAWDVDLVTSRVKRTVDVQDMFDVLKLQGRRVAVKRKSKTSKKSTSLVSTVAKANKNILTSAGLLQIVEEIDDSNRSIAQLNKDSKRRVKEGSRPTETLEIELPYDAMTFRRLQPVYFDNPEPVTGARGRYFISALSGVLDGSQAQLSLQLSRRPAFYEPQPTEAQDVKGSSAGADSVRGRIVLLATESLGRTGDFTYAQVRPIPRSLKGKVKTDCSGFATLCYHDAGAPDPNGAGFNGSGSTATLWTHGQPTTTPEPGDLAFYGQPTVAGSSAHVTVVISATECVGFGSQGGPRKSNIHYRNDFVGFRTYSVES